MKVNISIDDVTPFKLSSTKVLDQCFKLIEHFPDIKFTLFVPTAYNRTMGHTRTDKTYYISEYEDFCNTLKSLNINNFEIGYHGHYHGIPNISNNDEFKSLNYNEAKDRVQLMMDEGFKSGINFNPIFRPPAWKISCDAIRALKEVGINILAGSNRYKPSNLQGVKYVYETCSPPLSDLQLTNETEIVFHACEWDRNHFNNTFSTELIELLKHKDIDFVFMENF